MFPVPKPQPSKKKKPPRSYAEEKIDEIIEKIRHFDWTVEKDEYGIPFFRYVSDDKIVFTLKANTSAVLDIRSKDTVVSVCQDLTGIIYLFYQNLMGKLIREKKRTAEQHLVDTILATT